MINQMDTPKITGPQDYQRFYHTSSEGLVWLDRKGNPISLLHLLDMHVESIDPSELWNSAQTQKKVHKKNLTAPGTGHTNSTNIDSNESVMTTPTSPIMEHYVEVRHPEGSSISTVKDLLEDPQITTRDDAIHIECGHISVYTSKLPSTGDNNPVMTTNIPVGSTSNVETPDLNRQLSTYKERLALQLTHFKKQLETQNHIEVKCAKQNLKSEFDHEL